MTTPPPHHIIPGLQPFSMYTYDLLIAYAWTHQPALPIRLLVFLNNVVSNEVFLIMNKTHPENHDDDAIVF